MPSQIGGSSGSNKKGGQKGDNGKGRNAHKNKGTCHKDKSTGGKKGLKGKGIYEKDDDNNGIWTMIRLEPFGTLAKRPPSAML